MMLTYSFYSLHDFLLKIKKLSIHGGNFDETDELLLLTSI